MSRIRSKNTKPEIFVRSFLHKKGFRFRLHRPDLPGKPDIVLPAHHTVIFIHGCFWHGHRGCKNFVVPKTRTEWRLNKIRTNKKNDRKAAAKLIKDNWKIITVWECRLENKKSDKTLERIIKQLKK